MTPLFERSALDLARAIRRRELSATEVVQTLWIESREQPLRPNLESVRHAPHGGRILGWRGSGRRLRGLTVRRRLGHRGLDSDPGLVLRRVRTQAVVGSGPQHWALPPAHASRHDTVGRSAARGW